MATYEDIAANRDQYAPGYGETFLATDTQTLSLGDGNTWLELPGVPVSGAVDAGTLDGLDSSQFLRADQDDATTGALTVADLHRGKVGTAATATAAQTAVPIDTWTKVTLGTTEYDHYGAFDTATSTFTAPMAGIYQLDAQVGVSSQVAANTRVDVEIRINGTGQLRAGTVLGAAGYVPETDVGGAHHLAAGDAVTLWFKHTSDTAEDIGYPTRFTRLSVSYLG